MENVLVSMVLPAYNVAPYITETLESLLAQTHRRLEIIAVDDGSTDGTAALLDAFSRRDRRITVIHQENQGPAEARLRGIRAASGAYIGFADGDDVLAPEMVEHLLKNALSHCADISHCGYQMVFPNRVDNYYGTGRLLLQDRAAGLQDLLTGAFVEPSLGTKLFHRRLFASLPEDFDTTIRCNEDLLMGFYLFRGADSAVYEDVCLYRYLVRADSASHGPLNARRLLDPLRVAEILRAETENDPALRSLAEERLVRRLIALASIKESGNPDLLLPIRQDARRALRNRLGAILTGRHGGLKWKLQCLWAALSPGSYGLIHRRYEAITGLDKKYLPGGRA